MLALIVELSWRLRPNVNKPFLSRRPVSSASTWLTVVPRLRLSRGDRRQLQPSWAALWRVWSSRASWSGPNKALSMALLVWAELRVVDRLKDRVLLGAEYTVDNSQCCCR